MGKYANIMLEENRKKLSSKYDNFIKEFKKIYYNKKSYYIEIWNDTRKVDEEYRNIALKLNDVGIKLVDIFYCGVYYLSTKNVPELYFDKKDDATFDPIFLYLFLLYWMYRGYFDSSPCHYGEFKEHWGCIPSDFENIMLNYRRIWTDELVKINENNIESTLEIIDKHNDIFMDVIIYRKTYHK